MRTTRTTANGCSSTPLLDASGRFDGQSCWWPCGPADQSVVDHCEVSTGAVLGGAQACRLARAYMLRQSAAPRDSLVVEVVLDEQVVHWSERAPLQIELVDWEASA